MRSTTARRTRSTSTRSSRTSRGPRSTGASRARTRRSPRCARDPVGRTDTGSIVIAAPADAIYRAFADPAALMAWLPPGNMTGRALAYDFRPGGSYRIELAYRDDTAGKTAGNVDVSTGRFVALEPGRRIVQSVEFESADAAFGGEMIMTWTFEPLGERETRVAIVATNVPAGVSEEDHATGLRSSLDNLARYVTGRA
ncbi:MAG: SRPBCC domain-containing protein [Deltaproteobacteria bacterium]|nr:SRPBCC domain-containing protein [Deltaproteobacteria bacterium]